MRIDPPDGDPLDLVVIGGLTIDRLTDARLAPGGSVLHATRAARLAGLRVAVVTAAGPEPTARAGLDELERLAARVEAQAVAETIRFRHRETPAGRRLWLESVGAAIEPPRDGGSSVRAGAILFAPVASEVAARLLDLAPQWSSGEPVRGAILQGWLRRTRGEEEVVAIAPDELDDALVAPLSGFEVLVASREDLVATGTDPIEQLSALRSRVSAGPILVVTGGPEGVWIDDGASTPRHLPAPWRVEDVPTVGAGDAFAALLAAGLGADPARGRSGIDALATRAMRGVAEMLEARRS